MILTTEAVVADKPGKEYNARHGRNGRNDVIVFPVQSSHVWAKIIEYSICAFGTDEPCFYLRIARIFRAFFAVLATYLSANEW